jgi:cytochrome P450
LQGIKDFGNVTLEHSLLDHSMPRKLLVTLLQRIKKHPKAAAALGALLLSIVRHIRWRRRSLPRGAARISPGLLLGTLPELSKAAADNQIHDALLRLHKKHGKTMLVTAPFGLSQCGLITCDPKNVEHILKTNFDNYPKGPDIRAKLGDLLGRGIFNADGADWSQQRKTTSHMFTAKLFKEHIWLALQRNGKKMCDILSGSSLDKPVDIFNLMNRFTLDTIGEIGFGKVVGSLDDPSSPFLRSFDRAQQIAMMRFVNPLWRIQRLFSCGTERGKSGHFRRLDEYSRAVVRELQESLQGTAKVGWSDVEGKKSFVGLFLAEVHKSGDQVSEDYLRDLVLNFLIAGRDTTAQALSWTFFLLCQHPEVEEKARQEVNDVCGEEGVQYNDITRLPYLNAVLSEALRLYPSVPIDIKYTLADDVWPDGTVVPAGTNVAYNIFAMGRQAAIWGADAEVFRPERWLDMPDFPSNYVYPVFNGGPRECLGRRLAMIEMKTCLAMMLPRFRLQLAVPPAQIVKDSQLTIGMASGLPCYVAQLVGPDSKADIKSNVSTAACSDVAPLDESGEV